MSNWMPKSLWGWLGLLLIIGAVVYHRALSTIALIIGLVVGGYLYLYLDTSAPAAQASA